MQGTRDLIRHLSHIPSRLPESTLLELHFAWYKNIGDIMYPTPLQAMEKRWHSAIVSRSDISKFTGGLLTSKTLANADARGCGPKPRLRIGNKVAYPISAVLDYLASRIVIEEEGNDE